MESMIKAALAIVTVAVGVAYFVASSMVANEIAEPKWKQVARTAEYCWDEYERKSLDTVTKRLIANECERLEDRARRLKES